MDHNESFKMTYCAQQQQEIRDIRSKYLPQEPDKMEYLRFLDTSVTRRATALGLTVGIGGTLVMGLGMSLTLSDLGRALGDLSMVLGILLGLVGMAIMALAYPLYRRKLKKERARIAPEILRLTEELMR